MLLSFHKWFYLNFIVANGETALLGCDAVFLCFEKCFKRCIDNIFQCAIMVSFKDEQGDKIMKTKLEKVMELTPITMGINKERDSKIAQRWTHKGLDFLLEMWHKYYNTTAHLLIYSLFKFSERQLDLSKLEIALQDAMKYVVAE